MRVVPWHRQNLTWESVQTQAQAEALVFDAVVSMPGTPPGSKNHKMPLFVLWETNSSTDQTWTATSQTWLEHATEVALLRIQGPRIEGLSHVQLQHRKCCFYTWIGQVFSVFLLRVDRFEEPWVSVLDSVSCRFVLRCLTFLLNPQSWILMNWAHFCHNTIFCQEAGWESKFFFQRTTFRLSGDSGNKVDSVLGWTLGCDEDVLNWRIQIHAPKQHECEVYKGIIL